MEGRHQLAVAVGVVWLAASWPAIGSDDPFLAKVEAVGPIEALGLPVRAHLLDRNGCSYVLVVAPRSRLDASGAVYQILAEEAPEAGFGLVASHDRGIVGRELRVVGLSAPGTDSTTGEMVIPLDRDLVLSPPAVAPVLRQQAWNAQVAEMVATVRAADLSSWEGRLTGAEPALVGGLSLTISSRNTHSGAQIAAATQFVFDELRSMGLDVQFHDWSYALTANRNVVAEIPGGSRAAEIVLVTAHVDDMPPGGPAPGADDNASGVTGLLEMAKVLRSFRFERTIRFVVTTGEEQGLYGSKSYVSLLAARQESPVAVLNLDMIAWDARGGPVVNLHTRLPENPGYPADAAVARLFQDVVGWYGLSEVLTPRIVADGEVASDHSPFWAAGVPGVLAIEDDLDDFDTAYHSAYDTAVRLNFDYFTRFVRATVGTVAHLAGPAADGTQSLLVPVVLSAPGANGSYFTSQVAVVNHGASRAGVTYRYAASAGGGSGAIADSLGPGEQRIIPDAIEFLRSSGLPIASEGSRIGTLHVSFDGLSSSSDAGVLVRTTTPVPPWGPERGRAGVAYRGVPASSLPAGPVVLAALRQDGDDRSNVAVLNAANSDDGPVTLRLTFVEGRSGSAQGTVEVSLSPGDFRQFRLLDIAPSAAGRNGWVWVERVFGNAAWYAYGVVNDQVNSDGSFVVPVQTPSFLGLPAPDASSEVILPVVVETEGYSTEVSVTNVSGAARDLLLTFSSRAVLTPTNSAAMTIHLENGEQRIIPGFVAALRDSGAPGFAGANPLPFVGPLVASVPGGTTEGIVVTGRTLIGADASMGGAGRFGVAYGGVRPGEVSDGPVWLLGLQQDGRSRTNLAVVNAGKGDKDEIAVRIEVFDGETGYEAGELFRSVPGGQLVQVDGVLAQVPKPPRQGYARVTRLSGTGKLITYATVVDGASPGERSGDGAFVASESGF